MRLTSQRPSRPSPGTILAGIALFVALGGTALAATGTIVNIGDPTHATYLAKVTSRGELMTTQAPASPFTKSALFVPGQFYAVTAPTNGTIAFTRIDMTNPISQANGATLQVQLYEVGSTSSSSCVNSGNTAVVANYQIKPGDTILDSLPTPMVLKPLPGAPYWCLIVYSQSNAGGGAQSGYISLNGYAIAGSYAPYYAGKRLAHKVAGPLPPEARMLKRGR